MHGGRWWRTPQVAAAGHSNAAARAALLLEEGREQVVDFLSEGDAMGQLQLGGTPRTGGGGGARRWWRVQRRLGVRGGVLGGS